MNPLGWLPSTNNCLQSLLCIDERAKRWYRSAHHNQSSIHMSYRKQLHRYFNVSQADPFYVIKWWVYVNILDHGLLRAVYQNFHRIDDQIYRSSQPTTFTLRKFASNGGKTVLSLRGSIEAPYWYQEEETCSRLGLTLHNIQLSATSAPDPHRLNELIDFLGKCPKPLLIHCKSGADRTGLATFVYKTVFLQERFNKAKSALGFRFLHNRFGKAGVLDEFIQTYRNDAQELGLNFEEWLYTVYQQQKVYQ